MRRNTGLGYPSSLPTKTLGVKRVPTSLQRRRFGEQTGGARETGLNQGPKTWNLLSEIVYAQKNMHAHCPFQQAVLFGVSPVVSLQHTRPQLGQRTPGVDTAISSSSVEKLRTGAELSDARTCLVPDAKYT